MPPGMLSGFPRVLVVEDDVAIQSLFKAALAREPVHLDVASDGAEALALTRRGSYAVIILDLLMPRMSGFEFIDAFRAASPDAGTILIVVSAFDDALLAGLPPHYVHAVVRKPFDTPWLIELVGDLAQAWAAHQRGTARDPLGDLDAPDQARP